MCVCRVVLGAKKAVWSMKEHTPDRSRRTVVQFSLGPDARCDLWGYAIGAMPKKVSNIRRRRVCARTATADTLGGALGVGPSLSCGSGRSSRAAPAGPPGAGGGRGAHTVVAAQRVHTSVHSGVQALYQQAFAFFHHAIAKAQDLLVRLHYRRLHLNIIINGGAE